MTTMQEVVDKASQLVKKFDEMIGECLAEIAPERRGEYIVGFMVGKMLSQGLTPDEAKELFESWIESALTNIAKFKEIQR